MVNWTLSKLMEAVLYASNFDKLLVIELTFYKFSVSVKNFKTDYLFY